MSTLQNQLEAMETRITGLRELLKRREGAAVACRKNADPYAHSQNMDSQYGVLPAIRKELRDVSTQYLQLKIDTGQWDPAEVIERMSLPRVPVDRPANNADVMAKVREIVSSLPETATLQSLKELIA